METSRDWTPNGLLSPPFGFEDLRARIEVPDATSHRIEAEASNDFGDFEMTNMASVVDFTAWNQLSNVQPQGNLMMSDSQNINGLLNNFGNTGEGWNFHIEDDHATPFHTTALDMGRQSRSRGEEYEALSKVGEVCMNRRGYKLKQASDSSWEEDDRMPHFFKFHQEQLAIICEPCPNIERHFITTHLPRKKRDGLRALTHLKHVNRMELDRTRERRILVSTATIQSKRVSTLRRCRNERQTLWRLDPLALIIALPSKVHHDQLEGTLSHLNLPVPTGSCQLAYSQMKRIFLGVFQSAGDAATVLEHLPAKFHNIHYGDELQTRTVVSYRHWTEGTHPDATFTVFRDPDKQEHWTGNILFLLDCGYHPMPEKRYPPVAYSLKGSRAASQVSLLRRSSSRASESSDNDGHGSVRGRQSSTKRSRTDFESNESSLHESWYANSRSGTTSRDASLESTARRTRLPRQAGAYPCNEVGCGRVFDTDGERRKHGRVHKPLEERPHACSQCEKKFNDTKDLKRHAKVHLH